MTQKTLTKPFNELTPQELERRKNFDCGEHLIGVYWHKRDKVFMAMVNKNKGKQEFLGYFQH